MNVICARVARVGKHKNIKCSSKHLPNFIMLEKRFSFVSGGKLVVARFWNLFLQIFYCVHGAFAFNFIVIPS